MDKDKYIWKQRNEILHKKVNRQMAEIKDLHKHETIFDLARRFPNKTYRELEKFRDADRQEEANSIPLTDAQKSLVDNVEKSIEKNKEGRCIMGEMRKDREEEPKEKIKQLEEALANSLEINESHQKLNGKLQDRLTEVEEENKKLHAHVDKQVSGARKSGL